MLTATLVLVGLAPPAPANAQLQLDDVGLLWQRPTGGGALTTGSASGGLDRESFRGWPGNAERIAGVAEDGSFVLSERRLVATDDTGYRQLPFWAASSRAVALRHTGADMVVAAHEAHLSIYDLQELMAVDSHQDVETVLTETDHNVRLAWIAPDGSQMLYVDGTDLEAITLPVGVPRFVADLSAFAPFPHVELSWTPDSQMYAFAVATLDSSASVAQVRTRGHELVADLATPERMVSDIAYNPSGTMLWLEWVQPGGDGWNFNVAGVANRDGSNVRRLGATNPYGPGVGPTRALWLDDDTLLVPDITTDLLDLWNVDANASHESIGAIPEHYNPVRRLPVRAPANLPPAPPTEFRTGRLPLDAPIDAAASLSAARFGEDEATHAVLSRYDVFADSLAGAALTADGPLLFTTPDGLVPTTAQELQRVLPDGATVFVLGGENAISEAVVEAVEDLGFRVERLAGDSRIDTAVAVADEVLSRTGADELYVARAGSPASNPTAAWADSVAGGAASAATGIPVVVVGDTLPQAVADLIEEHDIVRTTVLGGAAAVTDAVLEALPSPRRLAGDTRMATAVAIAEDAFDFGDRTDGDMVLVNGVQLDGWAYGFAAAGFAAGLDMPVLLTAPDHLPAEVIAGLDGCADGWPHLIGSISLIGYQVVNDYVAACPT